jgi:nitrogen regulatory protein PII
MIPVMRIEIVIGARHSRRVTDLLDELGLDGWTLLRDASGKGERGPRFSDELTSATSNHWVLTTCPRERLDDVVEPIREMLKRYGGLCLVSEAHWLVH